MASGSVFCGAQNGGSLFKIAELMGNSPEIRQRHYAALLPELMRDTVEFDPRPRVVVAPDDTETRAS